MYPGPIPILGAAWATWNLVFLVGTAFGYVVLRRTFPAAGIREVPSFLFLRYVGCVYVCALGAQWFAYLVDANTTVLPPEGFSAWRYYLHPLAGPKTLYGAILVLPLGAAFFVPFGRLSWRRALD